MKHYYAAKVQLFALALAALATQHAFAGKPGGGTTVGSSAGVITIDQTKAAAGGVTAGDAPGFPVTLSEPGSYRLEGNLTVPDTSTTVIQITADDVTLDLNGFVVSGPNNCPTALTCMFTSGEAGILGTGNRTRIFGGAVRGMGSVGVKVGRAARVEHISAASNGRVGIEVGDGGLITECTAELNALYGVWAGNGSLVLRNIFANNGKGGYFNISGLGAVSIGSNVFMVNVNKPFDGIPVHILPNSCFGNNCF